MVLSIYEFEKLTALPQRWQSKEEAKYGCLNNRVGWTLINSLIIFLLSWVEPSRVDSSPIESSWAKFIKPNINAWRVVKQIRMKWDEPLLKKGRLNTFWHRIVQKIRIDLYWSELIIHLGILLSKKNMPHPTKRRRVTLLCIIPIGCYIRGL